MLSICFFTSMLSMSNVESEPNALFVELTTSGPRKGVIRLAVFDSAEGLEAEEPFFGKIIEFETSENSILAELGELPRGAFAIGAYHDLNNNGKLDRNLFGVPTEPYGFSGEIVSKWRAPEWDEVALTKDKCQQKIQLQLRYWKEM